MLLVGAGMAASGYIPFASTFAIFTERAFEQMRNGVARPNLAVHLCGSHGGTHTGTDGSSAQSIEDLAVFRTLPNVTVLHPCDDVSTRILTMRLADTKSPSYMRTARNKTPVLYDDVDPESIQIGKGIELRDGHDVAIIACGVLVSESLKAADMLKQEGIEVKPIITLGGSHSVNMVHFTDVKVPVENRVGEEGKGWGYAKGLLAHERTGLAGISKSLVALDYLRLQAGSVKRGNATLLDDPAYKAKLAELEIDLLATEFTELRSLASAANGAEPGPESSILKLKGTEIQQRIQKLTVEAGGIYSAAWGKKPVGHSFAKGGMSGYLASRAYTIYGGASEVQKDVVAKNVLGLKKAK